MEERILRRFIGFWIRQTNLDTAIRDGDTRVSKFAIS